jgi:ABC-type multidrug transport system ATPase subunit
LQEFYPQVTGFYTSTLRSGWKNLKLSEGYKESTLQLDARHINDGMLRVLAILAQIHAGHGLILFDEIENGINPELIDRLVQALLAADQQVIVTTHSPMILNYLPDEVAREAVVLLYKTPEGYSRAVRFFDLPVPSKKLEALGPGEVFVDTYLEDVVRDLGQEEAQS